MSVTAMAGFGGLAMLIVIGLPIIVIVVFAWKWWDRRQWEEAGRRARRILDESERRP